MDKRVAHLRLRHEITIGRGCAYSVNAQPRNKHILRALLRSINA
jgi:hypothetical protein